MAGGLKCNSVFIHACQTVGILRDALNYYIQVAGEAMKRLDYENAIAVTREIYWVGFNDAAAGLHCNPYLLLDGDESIFIDSGSIPDFPKVMRKVIDMTDPDSITHIIAQHQDPDVCGNMAVVEDVIERPDLRIVAHQHTEVDPLSRTANTLI